MKNIKLIPVLIMMLLVLVGCGEEVTFVSENSISEKELITLAQNEILRKTGDRVDVKITNTKDLVAEVGTPPFSSSYVVQNGKRYSFTIENIDDKEMVSSGVYMDGYKSINSNGIEEVKEPFYNDNYEKDKEYVLNKRKLTNVISSATDQYKIYFEDQKSAVFVYTYIPEYKTAKELLNNIEKFLNEYGKMDAKVYIYKDEEIYKTTDFEELKNSVVNSLNDPNDVYPFAEKKVIANNLEEFTNELFDAEIPSYSVEKNIIFVYSYNDYDKSGVVFEVRSI